MPKFKHLAMTLLQTNRNYIHEATIRLYLEIHSNARLNIFYHRLTSIHLTIKTFYTVWELDSIPPSEEVMGVLLIDTEREGM
jgi:hypothetical protein